VSVVDDALGDRWGYARFHVPDERGSKILLAPTFSAARTVSGKCRPGGLVSRVDPSPVQEATADSNGDFVLRGLPPGAFVLRHAGREIAVPTSNELHVSIGLFPEPELEIPK
jgi:hypothetical protein